LSSVSGWRVPVLEGQVRVAAADPDEQQSGEADDDVAQSARLHPRSAKGNLIRFRRMEELRNG
jgi:hypothetical protein